MFLTNPFAHMLGVVETLRPFTDIGKDAGLNLLTQAEVQLKTADERQLEEYPHLAEVAAMMGADEFDAVWTKYGPIANELDEDSKDLVAWAAIMLGNDLDERARLEIGEVADKLWLDACDMFESALKIKPEKHEALFNWGNSYLIQARSRPADTADDMWGKCVEKYRAALAIKSDDHDVLDGLGCALLGMAENQSANERQVLLKQALEAFKTVERLSPGRSAYNLSCCYGRLGQANEAALSIRLASNLDPYFPGCAEISGDTDFDLVRDTPEFKAALRDIGCLPEADEPTAPS
jgi:tetratricopeptide (TPR) repeat protein